MHLLQMLHPGILVVEVQQRPVVGMQPDQVMQLLEQATKPLHIAFRPQHVLAAGAAQPPNAGGGGFGTTSGVSAAYVQDLEHRFKQTQVQPIAPQFEVIRAIMLEDSPRVPHEQQHGAEQALLQSERRVPMTRAP